MLHFRGDVDSGALLQLSDLSLACFSPLSLWQDLRHTQTYCGPLVVLSSPAALLIGNTKLVRKYSESRCYGNNGQHQNCHAGKIQLHILAKLRAVIKSERKG